MQLGIELEKLRERAGATLAKVAKDLGLTESTLNRVEKGVSALRKASDLEALLEYYGITDEEDVEFLLRLHRESQQRGWWSPYRTFMPSGMAMYVGLESDARSLRVWQPNFVFGLLQTERYARALFETGKPVEEATTEFVERNIKLRMERKNLVTRAEKPVELWCILDEAALRRVMGHADIMREQYAEIAELTKMDHVTVQIIPMAAATYRADSNFTLLEFAAPLPSVVQAEGPGSVNVVDKDREIWKYTRRFDAMRAGALAPGETPAFLERLAREV